MPVTGVPNIDGTCWFSSLLTALLYSDMLYPLTARGVFFDARTAISYDLRVMLAHTMVQRRNTAVDVVFVDPAEIIHELHSIDHKAFPTTLADSRSRGGSPLVYLCDLLSLLNVSCATFASRKIKNTTASGTGSKTPSSCLYDLRVKKDRTYVLTHPDIRRCQIGRNDVRTQLQEALNRRKERPRNPDVVAIVVDSPDLPALPRVIPVDEGHDAYVLDACILEFPRHDVCGITLDGKEMVHENQAQAHTFRLDVRDAGGVVKRRHTEHFRYGCPLMEVRWKAGLRGVSGRDDAGDDACSFGGVTETGDPKAVQEGIFLYVLRSVHAEATKPHLPAMPNSVIRQQDILAITGFKTLLITRESSKQRRAIESRRRTQQSLQASTAMKLDKLLR